MVAEPNMDFQEQLKKLTTEFAVRLQQDLQRLKTLVQQGEEVKNAVLMHLHKLSGSALTFGFTEIGEQLRRIERALQDGSMEWVRCREAVLAVEFTQAEDTAVAVPKSVEHWQQHQQQVKSEEVDAAGVTLRREQDEEKSPPPLFKISRPRLGFLIQDTFNFSGLLAQLQAYNYDVVSLWSVAELLTQQRLSAFDVVMLAVPANDRDGSRMLATLDELKAAGLRVPVMVCSPFQSFAIKLQALRAGVVAYFDQAVTVSSLDIRIHRLLEEEQKFSPNVLLIDDDESILEHYRLTLESSGLRVRVLAYPAEVLTVLREFKPDVIVLDLNMPSCRGDEVAAIIRLEDTWLHSPIIYLSSETNQQRQIAAQTLAGDEFLTKPVPVDILVATIWARARRSRQLAQMLTRDGLTGLLTHSEIKDRLDQELVRVQRSQVQFCLAMLDIDFFKKVNDNYGHLVGDGVIRHLAGLLKGRLRRSDLIGRYGGEEFLLILPDCDLEQAGKIVDELRKGFAELPMSTAIQGFYCTFSAGVSCSNQVSDAMGDTLIMLADEALYQAKSQGRNQVVLAS